VSKKSKLKAMAEAGNPWAVKTLREKQERHVVKFNPKQTIVTQAEASSVISYAQKVKDWPALEKAVAIKIEDQREHVAWWDETVRPAGGDRKSADQVPKDAHLISYEEAEAETSIDHRVVSRWRKGLSDVDAYRLRMYGRAYAAAMGLDQKTAKTWRQSAASRTLPSDCRLICADVATVEIEPQSVDLILTDPPYPEKYLSVYETLARRAPSWLKPGGSLLCMCGQSYLPKILALMTPHIRYHWTLGYLTPGQKTKIWQRNIHTSWKPVFWFVNGAYKGDWVGDDVALSVANDKRFHHWGQSESGIADLLSRFASPGQLVFDPFVGGGTTAAAALKIGLRFVGSDIDPVAIEKLRVRGA